MRGMWRFQVSNEGPHRESAHRRAERERIGLCGMINFSPALPATPRRRAAGQPSIAKSAMAVK